MLFVGSTRRLEDLGRTLGRLGGCYATFWYRFRLFELFRLPYKKIRSQVGCLEGRVREPSVYAKNLLEHFRSIGDLSMALLED